jgi:hypothetical protein
MSLRALQRDLRAWLTEESAEAAARLGTGAAAGLSVYLNNFRSQLMACLAETFETVHTWMGDAAFEAAAATHIDRVQPCSWTLDAYAQRFPATLEALYPDDLEIGELAHLERALAEIFVGPDSLSIAAAGIGEVDWDRAVLSLVPTFALLPARTNAAAIWSAVSEGTPPPQAMLLPEPASIALWRRGFTPAFRTVDQGEAEALRKVAAGESFGALCTMLVARHGEAAAPAMAGAWLGQWLREGLIAAIRPGSADEHG